MTRSSTLTQSLAVVLFAVTLAVAMPVSAWNSDDYDNPDRYYDYPYSYYDIEDNDRRTHIPTCSIQARPNTVKFYGGTVTLEWDSSYADWAHISDVGIVQTHGSMQVNVNTSKTYTLTVYNEGRSETCDTFVNVLGEVRSGGYYGTGYYSYNYNQTPYVLLTQIPYTGFDFGPLGNALYWMTLATIAIGGAYLLIYQSGMRALVSISVVEETIRAGKQQLRAIKGFTRAASAPAVVHTEAHVAAEPRRSGDVMELVEGETPRIVIRRD